LTSFYEHNQRAQLDKVLDALNRADVALISDAGMPAINDPGYLLVQAALEAGHAVSPIPGPSAPIAALAASGLASDHFLYLGYLPRKSSERQSALHAVAALPYTLIFLESPHRLLPTLQDSYAVLGNRRIAVAAEMTKLFERFFRGSLKEALDFYEEEPARGEFTVVLEGAPRDSGAWDEAQVLAALKLGLAGDKSPSQLARQVAADSGWKRSEVYDLVRGLQRK
jgi:16S rRNA (cytidine1402-2'-O)-methyltransferase